MKRFEEFAQVDKHLRAAIKPLSHSHRPLSEGQTLARLGDETQFAWPDGEPPFEFTELDHEKTGLPFTVWAQMSVGASYEVRIAISPDRFTRKRDWTLAVELRGKRRKGQC